MKCRKIAELLGAALQWMVTIEGQDEYGKSQRAQLRIEKGLERLTVGHISLPIDARKPIMSTLQDLS